MVYTGGIESYPRGSNQQEQHEAMVKLIKSGNELNFPLIKVKKNFRTITSCNVKEYAANNCHRVANIFYGQNQCQQSWIFDYLLAIYNQSPSYNLPDNFIAMIAEHIHAKNAKGPFKTLWDQVTSIHNRLSLISNI